MGRSRYPETAVSHIAAPTAVLSAAPNDLQAHIALLEAKGLLTRIDRPINKDTELHPLARWQFQGGLHEDERRAFLFTNVVDSKGKTYDIPVLVGGLAASPEIRSWRSRRGDRQGLGQRRRRADRAPCAGPRGLPGSCADGRRPDQA
jgi:hypothetical protein